MTLYDITISKINQLPDSLVQEVNNFIDFLLLKYNSELPQLTESDFSDYLNNLEAYEENLACGEIQW
ncbi:DUF2281 domain-containing protein [Microcoleus sp. A006_D1]|uniref:DUF2281 domain-containing protein n=1 Tax=Microcoleus sp. A006_D1 TaxID=3055267 RepID=UPI002FD25CBE